MQALSAGLEWANFHVFSLSSSNQPNASTESGRRKTKGSGADDLEGEAETSISIGGFLRSCPALRQSSRELSATVLMAAISLFSVMLARMAINAVIRKIFQCRGRETDGPAIPFGSWEVTVFMLQYQGLAESAGEAIASRCLGYELFGGLLLFLLLMICAAVCLFTYWAIHTKRVVWVTRTVKEDISEVKHSVKDSRGTGLIHRVRVLYATFNAINNRGSWEAATKDGEPNAKGEFAVNIFGGFFDSAVGGAWWYGFWSLCRCMAMGLILPAVFESTANAATIMALSTADSIFLLFAQPQVEWMGFFQETYKSAVNLANLATILSYLQGRISASWFTNIFLWLSVVSLVPSSLISILGPMYSMFKIIANWCASCGGLLGVARLGAASGTAMTAMAVLRGDDGMHDNALAALESQVKAHSHVRTGLALATNCIGRCGMLSSARCRAGFRGRSVSFQTCSISDVKTPVVLWRKARALDLALMH